MGPKKLEKISKKWHYKGENYNENKMVLETKNPYQAIIDVIDVILTKNEIVPKRITIHVCETPLPQSGLGSEQLRQIINMLKRSGAITENTDRSPHVIKVKKTALFKERNKWIKRGGGFEGKIILKPKNKKTNLFNFPADLKWEEISIQFLNEHEVIIKSRGDTHQTTYEVMGFQDAKKKLPNKQWQFLRLLAIKNGEVSWENNYNLPLKQINSIKKQKQLLSETLKACFQIYDDEPFEDYKTEGAYRIKIKLIPESD